MIVALFWVVVGGSRFILGSGEWWWMMVRLFWLVLNLFWVVVGGGPYFLGGGG